jgi:hypothetical protein
MKKWETKKDSLRDSATLSRGAFKGIQSGLFT